ncbi:MAG TPA: glycosyltransferase family 39 protein, partial [Anaerolineae bacterium]|nr:glycosyltransferase family 39 protein [Anaerolineae bacterium]
MRKFLKEWAPVIGLMLLAGVLRLYELGSWPPGLYHDEAFNGLDALRVIGGERPLYFAANHGREPFFIYLVALSVEWLGRTIYALRLPSALIGILTIPVTYWMARELFNRRVGLLTAAFMTMTLWPIHLSLVSFRAGSLPLFIALSIATGVRAYRSGRWFDWLIAGALYGASFYTYLASRFTPLVLIVFGLGLILSRRLKRLWPGALIFCLAALIVVAPLAITAFTNWDVVMGRPGDISILNPVINGGDPVGTAIGNIFKALGMFFWQGDGIPRHNVPYRPVFDWLVTIVFVFGLVRLILGAIQRRRPAVPPLPDFLDYTPIARVSLPAKLPSVLVLLWIGVMLLPTILAEDTPHFLRAVGVLPIVMVIPAIGL